MRTRSWKSTRTRWGRLELATSAIPLGKQFLEGVLLDPRCALTGVKSTLCTYVFNNLIFNLYAVVKNMF